MRESIIKKSLKEKWYLFSVVGIFFLLGLSWYVRNRIQCCIPKLLEVLKIDIYSDFYYWLYKFTRQDHRWIGYMFSLVNLAVMLITCYVMGRLVLHNLSKKQIAASCMVYNVYALSVVGILILMYKFVLINDVVQYNSLLKEIASNCCSLISIGVVATDIRIVENTAYLVLGTIFTGDEIEKYDIVFKVAYYIDLAMQLVWPYLFVFFGKSNKCQKFKS